MKIIAGWFNAEDKHSSVMQKQSNALNKLSAQAHNNSKVNNIVHDKLAQSHLEHSSLANKLANSHRTLGNHKIADKYASMEAHHINMAKTHQKALGIIGRTTRAMARNPVKTALAAGVTIGLVKLHNRKKVDDEN